jgi:hypothetical protein
MGFVLGFFEEFTALHFRPNLVDRLIFDVPDAVGVVIAAGDSVAVLSDAHESAEEAPAQKEAAVPLFEVGHTSLFCNSCIEGYVDVYGWGAHVFLV